jgi:large subunit ribosomal protein L9
MKVLLLRDAPNIGKKWDVVNVKSGFARNFLIPKKIAIVFNEKNKKEVEHIQKLIKYQKEKDQKRFQTLFDLLNGKVFAIKVQTTEIGTLYDTIREKDLAKYLTQVVNKSVSEEFLELEEKINQTGSYKVYLISNGGRKGYFWLYVVSFSG